MSVYKEILRVMAKGMPFAEGEITYGVDHLATLRRFVSGYEGKFATLVVMNYHDANWSEISEMTTSDDMGKMFDDATESCESYSDDDDATVYIMTRTSDEKMPVNLTRIERKINIVEHPIKLRPRDVRPRVAHPIDVSVAQG